MTPEQPPQWPKGEGEIHELAQQSAEHVADELHNDSAEAHEQMSTAQIAELAKGLSEKEGGFPFPGILAEVIAELQAEDEAYPGLVTPIDELLKRLEAEGIKVVLGDDPTNGDAWILPIGSSNVEMDSVRPKHLELNDQMDPELKQLCIQARMKAAAKKK